MVHALNQIWRTLVPGGLLLDLRPYSNMRPLEVGSGARYSVAGPVDDSLGLIDDIPASAAIAQAAREGWFELERSDSFELLSYWDSLGEMIDYVAENWSDWMSFPPDTLERARQLEAAIDYPRVRIRLNMIIGRYRKAIANGAR